MHAGLDAEWGHAVKLLVQTFFCLLYFCCFLLLVFVFSEALSGRVIFFLHGAINDIRLYLGSGIKVYVILSLIHI